MVHVESSTGRESVLEITIHEGRNRIVRRMLEAVDYPVRALERVGFGPLRLARLRAGDSRRLRPPEVEALRRAAGLSGLMSESAPVSGRSTCTTGGCYALRGAISIDDNTEQAILVGTRELVEAIMERNDLSPEQMVSCVFSATTDLNAQFPAVAARDLGLNRVPLLCTQEIDVPGALPRVIRVLLHYYAADGHAPQHVYLREARTLRGDLDSAQ